MYILMILSLLGYGAVPTGKQTSHNIWTFINIAVKTSNLVMRILLLPILPAYSGQKH
jgi:hypothetical protein